MDNISKEKDMSRYWARLFLVLSMVWLSSRPLLAGEAIAEEASPAEYMAQGLRAFQRGMFDQAALHWLAAVRFYEQAGKRDTQRTALIYLARAYRALGQYREAVKSLAMARTLAERDNDHTHLAVILGSLGDLLLATGALEEAEGPLQEGLRLAQEEHQTALAAVTLNNLGNLQIALKQYEAALSAYTDSAHLAQQVTDYALQARALLNAAVAAQELERPLETKERLDSAQSALQHVAPSHDKTYDLITLGLAYKALRSLLPEMQDALVLQSASAFETARGMAQMLGDVRAVSYALGHLGTLYETAGRYEEALQLTRQALFAAQQVQAPESTYRWQWQRGRLLKEQGKLEAAIVAYRQAVATLQSFRQEIDHSYGTRRVSFREAVGPVYFELVDLLLKQAATLSEPSQYEPYLREARDAVESLKAFELQDYFQDACVDAARGKATSLERVSQTAVVIYPILLPDRLELLVGLPTGLKRFAVPVARDTLTSTVRELRYTLEKRTTRQYLPYAQQVYDWLIRPLDTELRSAAIDTLVFVPDGPLRTIPMAALHDGEHFLIERYAVAITPGLNLTEPRPLPRRNIKLLVAGLSEAVQGFAPLPSVSKEVMAIENLYEGDTLFNDTFLLSSVEKELRDKAFTIVHIASHGQFRGTLSDTFLLTYDAKLTLDRLEEIIGLLQFRQEPLELLTLSACQTAAGDDRAALGLAGIAIKAGARSALATLWYISDQASADLVAEFYRQLQNANVSRAKALQQAQLALLATPGYQHPGYWAPFLMLNNWL